MSLNRDMWVIDPKTTASDAIFDPVKKQFQFEGYKMAVRILNRTQEQQENRDLLVDCLLSGVYENCNAWQANFDIRKHLAPDQYIQFEAAFGIDYEKFVKAHGDPAHTKLMSQEQQEQIAMMIERNEI